MNFANQLIFKINKTVTMKGFLRTNKVENVLGRFLPPYIGGVANMAQNCSK